MADDAGDRPEVAVLDAEMPGMTGLEVARRVRADPRLAATRLVLVTGHAGAEEVASAAGVDVSIAKPFSPIALRNAVRELLDRAA